MARAPFQEILPLLLVLILLCFSSLPSSDARPHANAVQAETNPYPNIYPRIDFEQQKRHPIAVPTYSWQYPNTTTTSKKPKHTGYY